MYKNILFDLDGTLTDPKVGITKCVAYALKYFGIEVEDTDTLCDFIGPPLSTMFAKCYGFDEGQCTKAIEVYRERFSTVGKFENEVYPYTEKILSLLKDKGIRLFVATSKPEKFAVEILEHFGLSHYFERIRGIGMDEEKVEKDVIITRVMSEYNLSPADTVMVGDRCFDIIGAHKNGIRCIGVLFGYGSKDELAEHKADIIIDTNKDLFDYFGSIL